VFGRGLERGREVDAFGDWEYSGRKYEKGGDGEVLGGMGWAGGEKNNV